MIDSQDRDRGDKKEAIEVRVVAMLTGEASDFEKSALADELAEYPELASYVREMGRVHALLTAAFGNSGNSGWRLPDAKREALLKQLSNREGGESEGQGVRHTSPVKPLQRGLRIISVFKHPALLASAAVVVLGVLLSMLMPIFQRYALPGFLETAQLEEAVFAGEAGGYAGGVDGEKEGQIEYGAESTRRSSVSSELEVDGRQSEEMPGISAGFTLQATPSMSASQIAKDSLQKAPLPVARRSPAPARSAAGFDADARELTGDEFKSNWRGSSVQNTQSVNAIKNFTAGWGKGSRAERGIRERAFPSEHAEAASDLSLLESRRDLAGYEKTRKAPESVVAAEQPVSTFSLYVSDASFRVAAEALGLGRLPEPSAVRVEEFTNAFDYGDLAPTGEVPVALALEQVADPQLTQTRLVRMTIRAAAEGRIGSKRLNLTLALDVSGSMKRQDRADALRRAAESLLGQLAEQDTLSIVVFDRTAELVADRTRGAEAAQALDGAVNRPGTNGTNIEEGLRMAAEHAKRIKDASAMNRVVLVTDGIANLGATVPESVAATVRELRAFGIATDVVGVSPKDLDNRLLEVMARAGDGRHLVVGSGQDDAERLGEQLAGSFRPAASNVKLQVRFNPRRVEIYRLMGFERHMLDESDFRNDAVDAAELGAAEDATALYRVRVLAEGSGDIGTVSIRFRASSSGRMVEHTWVIPYKEPLLTLDEAPASMRLAVAATLLGDALAHPGTYGSEELASLRKSLASAPALVRSPRINQLLDMLEKSSRMLEGRQY